MSKNIKIPKIVTINSLSESISDRNSVEKSYYLNLTLS